MTQLSKSITHILKPPPTVVRTYKYRIYPKRSQQTMFQNQCSMCRYLYNWSVEERKKAYELDKTTVSYYEQAHKLSELKEQRPWFKGVYSQSLQYTLRTLDEAFKSFYRHVKAHGTHGTKTGRLQGYPRFKKKGQWNTLTYPQYRGYPCSTIEVPKLGTIKMQMHRDVPSDTKVRTLQITYEGGKYFACFTCEIPSHNTVLKQDLSSIGIDLGCKNYMYTSSGIYTPAPKRYKRKYKLLKQLQRRFVKCKKYTTKWYKLLRAIQRTYYKLRCFMTNFRHKLTNQVLALSNLIFLEDLNIKNMVRRPDKIKLPDGTYATNNAKYLAMLHQSISWMGWYDFRTILEYKAKALNKIVIVVPAEYTSQECSKCGTLVRKSLAQRVHKCKHCNLSIDRDLNAALNIKQRGIRMIQEDTTIPSLRAYI